MDRAASKRLAQTPARHEIPGSPAHPRLPPQAGIIHISEVFVQGDITLVPHRIQTNLKEMIEVT